MTSETLDILEEASDTIEQTLDVVDEVLASQPGTGTYILAGLVGVAVGGAVSYLVTKRIMKTKYEALVEQEIAEAKAFYSRLNKDEYATPEQAVKKLRRSYDPPEDLVVASATDALKKYQGEEDEPEEDEDEVEEEQTVNVFLQAESDEDEFDLEAEELKRDPEHPYIISEEEFLLGPDYNTKTSITWYAGDQTLADERDQEIPLVDKIVGEANLERFGYGSNDSRVVYIRNEKMSTDFEVLKHDGKYAHEVLGFEHSEGSARDRRRANAPRKHRGEDE